MTDPVAEDPERAEQHPPDHHHADVSGGWLRPAVFGAMDGLVSNTALIAGVAGGGVAPRTVALTGLAGLAAGAFSMAAGEYVSVASQAELAEAEIELEKSELQRVPRAEEAELAEAYRKKGLDEATAREVARQLSRDPEVAWREHAREELGIDPDDLPSARLAAGSSFVSFAIGAAVPVVPYLLGGESLAVPLAASGAALFGAGALVSRFTSRSALASGSRQLALGAAAAALTFAVGAAVGTGV